MCSLSTSNAQPQSSAGSGRSGQNFITGAAILGVAGVLVKIISACFKIPLTNIVGSDAMLYFTNAYTIYTALINISAAGLSVAVAKCISEYVALGRYRDVKSVTRAANLTFVIIGLICSVVFFVFAEDISLLISGTTKSAPACMAMAPAILFVSVQSVYKGYAQGYSDMTSSAIGNILEVVIKLIFGLGGAYLLLNMGFDMPIVMAGAVGGVSFGSFVSMSYLIISKKVMKRRYDRLYPTTELTPAQAPFLSVMKKFIWIAFPITIGSLASNLGSTVDLAIVQRRLLELPGATTKMVEEWYGAYSSMAYTVFQMPYTIILSIGISVLPAVSAAFAVKHQERLQTTVNTAVKLCSLVAMPCAFGMMALSGPILDLLFSDEKGIAIATPLLAYLGAAFFFMCCAAIFSPLLQAVGRASIPVINTAIAIGVKILCNYILVAIPEIGINGAAISNIVLYVVLFALNLIALRRITKVRTDIKSVYIKPLIGGALCGLTAWCVYALLGDRLGNSIATVVAIGLAAIVYFAFILFSKTIKKDDVEFLPKAKKIEKILEKRNWIG